MCCCLINLKKMIGREVAVVLVVSNGSGGSIELY